MLRVAQLLQLRFEVATWPGLKEDADRCLVGPKQDDEDLQDVLLLVSPGALDKLHI